MNKLRKKILDNMDDLVENTFVYSLHEKSIFNGAQLNSFICDLENYIQTRKKGDIEMREVLIRIVQYISDSFDYHHDHNDSFRIKNYSCDIEKKWYSCWKIKIEKLISML